MLELRRKRFILSNYISALDYLLRGYLKERRGKNLAKTLAQKYEQRVIDVIREVHTFNNTVIKWESYFRIKLIFEGAIAEERVEPMEKSQRIRITFQPSQVHGQGEGTRAR